MLSRLTIRNIVLIEEADIPFADGLCVLTGETGAGKSILLDALGLVLGRRGESRLVRHGADQAVVAAEFVLRKAANVRALLNEQGLPVEDVLHIRRVLQKDGGGRAFVNGEAVSVGTLKALGEMLVEIHGQHDQRGLMDASTHALALDRFGRLENQRVRVAQDYAAWRSAQAELTRLEEEVQAAKREEDYLRHVAAELSKLKPQAGEEEELSTARTRMMQNEKLASLLQEGLGMLQDGDHALLSAARNLHRTLARSSLNTDGRFDAALEALDRAGNELSQVEDDLEDLQRGAEYDPRELERMEERLFALKAAARKHQVAPDELPALLEDTHRKLATLAAQDNALGQAQKAAQATREAYVAAAAKLSKAREKPVAALQDAMHTELAPLRMGATRFVALREALAEAQWHAGGTESVRFEVATNAGQASGSLGKIASGGELSRLMLALKVILADVQAAPTLIFDEIDTGTGGATADAIGTRLAALGDTHQVLVVTHLPQVAAKGAHHLKIDKQEAKGATHTNVHALDTAERRQELARMLSGEEVTKEALSAAKKLLETKRVVA